MPNESSLVTVSIEDLIEVIQCQGKIQGKLVKDLMITSSALYTLIDEVHKMKEEKCL